MTKDSQPLHSKECVEDLTLELLGHNQLQAKQAVAVRRHLATCPACARRLADIEAEAEIEQLAREAESALSHEQREAIIRRSNILTQGTGGETTQTVE